MLPERNFAPSMVEVTLVLVTGKSHSGYLTRFSPTAPDIALGLTHPPTEHLGRAVELLSDRSNRRPLGRMLRGVLEDHPDGALT